MSDAPKLLHDDYDSNVENEEYDYDPNRTPFYPEVADWEVERAEESSREMYSLSPTDFAEMAFRYPNPTTRKLENLDFGARPYLKRPYNARAQRTIFLCGRQVEKSTSLANTLLSLACLIPHFKSLYVSPSSTQTKDFSKSRLKEAIETSEVVGTWFPPYLTDNVYAKKALNRSEIILRYAYLNADRTRGLSADFIAIDEFQDILLENIPVIEEAASHSAFKWFLYSGTPKSQDNPIEHYYATYSTQCEWAIPCERHGTPKNPGSWHWNLLGEKNIGLKGLSCDKCGRIIDSTHPMCQWVQTAFPDKEKFETFDGYRIPQLMVPWIPWKDILNKYNKYPKAQFYNEVLGQSFDSGQRPLTQTDVMDNCDDSIRISADFMRDIKRRLGSTAVYAGIDWGQDSTNSYTVLMLAAMLDGRFTVFYVHRFAGSEQGDTQGQIQKITALVKAFNVVRIGVDYGGGHFPNDQLAREFGHKRVQRFQYTTPNTFMEYKSQLGRWIVHKHEIMSAIFTAIKNRNVFRFPAWKDFQSPHAKDFTATYSEYNERRRLTEYKKSPNSTDDAFHSLVFCFLAYIIDNQRPDIFIPGQKIDQKMDEYGYS